MPFRFLGSNQAPDDRYKYDEYISALTCLLNASVIFWLIIFASLLLSLRLERGARLWRAPPAATALATAAAGTAPVSAAATGHPETILWHLAGEVTAEDFLHVAAHTRNHPDSATNEHAFEHLRHRAADQYVYTQVGDLGDAVWQVRCRQVYLVPLNLSAGLGLDHQNLTGGIQDRRYPSTPYWDRHVHHPLTLHAACH